MTATSTRRQFLKLSGIGTAGAAAAGLGGLGFDVAFAKERVARRKLEGTKTTAGICPYCAVGCGTLVQTRHNDQSGLVEIVNIEGNPDSPINGGTLCPKGAAIYQLHVNPNRVTDVLYRAPGATSWEVIGLEQAMDMVAERVKKTRDETFVETTQVTNPDGTTSERILNHTLQIFSLGGATMDDEWNHIHQKLMRGLGIVAIENQARI